MLLHTSHHTMQPQNKELSAPIVSFSVVGKPCNTAGVAILQSCNTQAFDTLAWIVCTNTYYNVRFTEGNTEGSGGR